jgi:hypothetical protein
VGFPAVVRPGRGSGRSDALPSWRAAPLAGSNGVVQSGSRRGLSLGLSASELVRPCSYSESWEFHRRDVARRDGSGSACWRYQPSHGGSTGGTWPGAMGVAPHAGLPFPNHGSAARGTWPGGLGPAPHVGSFIRVMRVPTTAGRGPAGWECLCMAGSLVGGRSRFGKPYGVDASGRPFS